MMGDPSGMSAGAAMTKNRPWPSGRLTALPKSLNSASDITSERRLGSSGANRVSGTGHSAYIFFTTV